MSQFFKPLLGFVDDLLLPLEVALENEVSFQVYLANLGWDSSVSADSMEEVRNIFGITDLRSSVEDIIEGLENLSEDPEKIVDLVKATLSLLERLRQLESVSVSHLPSPLNQSSFWKEFAKNIIDELLIHYLEIRQPGLFSFLYLTGIVVESEQPLEDRSVRYQKSSINWGQFGDILTKPDSAIKDFYGWSKSGPAILIKHQRFLLALRRVFYSLGFSADLSLPSHDLAGRFVAPEAINDKDIHQLNIWFLEGIPPDDSGSYRLGCQFLPIPETPQALTSPAGFLITPVVQGAAGFSLPLSRDFALEFEGDFQSHRSFMFKVFPGKSSMKVDKPGGVINAMIHLIGQPADPWVLLGNVDTSRLTVGGIDGFLKVNGTEDNPNLGLGFDVLDGNLVIDAGEGDGFIQKILPSDPIVISFDLGVEFNDKDGFRISGAAGFTFRKHLNESFGPVLLQFIDLGFFVKGSDLRFQFGLTGRVGLGPLILSIENVGLHVTFEVGTPGLLGNADIDLGFKGPDGVGCVVESSALTGGGFLKRDDQGYAGILQLNLKEIGLLGIGLITTGGEHGFSMLISIVGDFPKPIQLSFGFALKAVGGLIGINRSLDIEAMQAGFKNGIVDSVLFPEDPLKNATKIISDLRTVMPPDEGQFIVGPSLTIVWSNDSWVQAELGIFIEFPDPVRIVILGQLHVTVPAPKFATIEIHLDVLGALDFGKSEFSICARLYHSKVQGIPIQGEAALRWNWGKNPMFALSCGGFHPEFPLPPGFPLLKRCGMQFKLGPFHLDFGFYLAIAPNAFMFGAALHIEGKIGPLKIVGGFAFHALFFFDPFRFQITIEAYLSVKVKKWTLAGVSLRNGRLAGTRPWNIAGKVKVKVCWFKASKSFCKSWGPREPIHRPSLNPLTLVIEALRKAQNYRGVLPPATTMVETLRSLTEDRITTNDASTPQNPQAEPILIHPSGQLEIVQHELPLETTLELVHHAPLAEYKRIRLLPPDEFATETLMDFFARAEYQKLSKDERFREQFELFPYGLSLNAKTIQIPEQKSGLDAPEPLQAIPYAYECWMWDQEETLEPCDPPPPDQPIIQAWRIGERQLESSAVTKLKEFVRHSAYLEKITRDPEIEINPRAYHIVGVGNLHEPVAWETSVRNGRPSLTRTEATQLLTSHLEGHPEDLGELEIVPDYELIGRGN